MRKACNKKSVIVYDDSCGFCRQAIRTIRIRDRDEQFVYLARQMPGIEEQFPGLRVGDFDAGMRLFEPDGKMHIGADAIYRITLRLPYFRWVSWMYRLPVLNGIIRSLYSFIAANRLNLSRYCSDGCTIDNSTHGISQSKPSKSVPTRHIILSLIILLLLGVQGWANVAKAIRPSSGLGDRSWPFLAYGMYRHSYGPGTIRTTKQHVIAITSRGNELKIDPHAAGMYGQALQRHYLDPMLSGDPSAPILLTNRLNTGREDPIVALRVERETYAISDAGLIPEGKQSIVFSASN